MNFSSLSAKARSSSCIARVGMIVMVSPGWWPPTALAGPSWRARRRPSVATAVICRPSTPAARRPRRSGCSRCPWRRPSAARFPGRTGPAFRGTSLRRNRPRRGTRPGFSEGRRNSLRSPRTRVLRPSLSRYSFSSLLSRRIEPKRAIGKITLPGADLQARHVDADAHFQIGGHQDRPVVRTSILTFCRIGLGLRVGATLAAV